MNWIWADPGDKFLPPHKAEMSREGPHSWQDVGTVSRNWDAVLLSTPFMGTTCVACPDSPQDTSFPLGYRAAHMWMVEQEPATMSSSWSPELVNKSLSLIKDTLQT